MRTPYQKIKMKERGVQIIRVVFGLVIIGMIVLLFTWSVDNNTEIIRLEDGHQYIRAYGTDGGVDITHLEGCDHPDHDK